MNSLTALLSLFVPKLNLPPAVGEPQWLGQHHATPARKQRRALVKQFGRRQAIKTIKAERRAYKEADMSVLLADMAA